MSEDKARQIALILQAIDDAQREKAEANAEFNTRLRTLNSELYKARRNILSGQLSIIDAIRENLPEIERQLNKDSPDTKVTLGITQDKELQPAGD